MRGQKNVHRGPTITLPVCKLVLGNACLIFSVLKALMIFIITDTSFRQQSCTVLYKHIVIFPWVCQEVFRD